MAAEVDFLNWHSNSGKVLLPLLKPATNTQDVMEAAAPNALLPDLKYEAWEKLIVNAAFLVLLARE
jgi:ketopantoate reductase